MKRLSPKQSAIILGSGVSGKSAASLLGTINATCRFYSESKNDSDLRERILPNPAQLSRFIKLDTPDFAVISPGFDPQHAAVRVLQDHMIPTFSELDIARRFYDGKVLGITGTNGKTTAALMTAHILNGYGVSTIAAGNTGHPLSSVVVQGAHPKVIVLEVSSYQLHWSAKLRLEAAGITSLAPDHLKWHGGLQEYYAAKGSIANHTNAIFLTHAASQILNKANIRFPHSVVEPATDVPFDAVHDCSNANLAMRLCNEVANMSRDMQVQSLKTFVKPKFRFESFKFRSHVIINDSKSTNCASTEAALATVERPCLLLLGGLDKGESFAGLEKYKNTIEEIWLFGRAASRLEPVLTPWARVVKFATLKEASDKLRRRLGTTSDETVLFSPGCASQDEFNDFIQRGSFFNEVLAESTTPKSKTEAALQ